MAVPENLPFPVGTTYFGAGGTPNATDGASLEGREYEVEDTTPAGVRRSNRRRTLRVVRWTQSAFNALPKHLVTFEASADNEGQCDGRVTTTAARCYPVDEYLPSAGVVQHDLFYVVVKGPAVCVTPMSNTSADMAAGNFLVSITAATSGATTAGRLTNQDLTGATALLANQVQNRVGVAVTSRVTNSTNTDILVNIGSW